MEEGFEIIMDGTESWWPKFEENTAKNIKVVFVFRYYPIDERKMVVGVPFIFLRELYFWFQLNIALLIDNPCQGSQGPKKSLN